MLNTLKLFFNTKEANSFLVVMCLLLASLAETIGIGTLLPVISMAAGVESSGSSQVGQYAASALAWVGLPATLGSLVSMVAIFMVLKALLTYAALAYAAFAAARVSTALRQKLLYAIFNARWGFFSDKKSGGISNLVGREAGLAGESYVISANVVSSLIQAIAFAIIAMAMNWKLALTAAVVGLLLAGGLQGFVKSARKASYRQTDRTTALLSDMVDALANIKPLKSMHRYEPLLKSINRIFEKLRKSSIRRELAKAGLAQGGTAVFAIIASAGIYFASTFLNVPFPDLLVSAIILNAVVSAVSRSQRLVQMASLLESSHVRTLELINETESNREINTGKAPPVIGDGCSFESVYFSHGETEILADVSLSIPSNAITVLSGPSGAGKTTIIDLLIGLHRPNSGRILIGAAPIESVDMVAWRKQVGYVPQELSLFHSSIRANLTLGDPSIDDDAIMSALRQAGAEDFVSQMPKGLDTDVGEMGTKLSGGQRQRISLARALVCSPKILILDEVTSALDPETEAEIVDNIAGLHGNYTILAITHRPAWTKVADRLYQVSGGQVSMVTPAIAGR
jgi:ATP-binding cassette subfamily C protein